MFLKKAQICRVLGFFLALLRAWCNHDDLPNTKHEIIVVNDTFSDLMIRVQSLLSRPVVNLGSTVNKWVFAVSVLALNKLYPAFLGASMLFSVRLIIFRLRGRDTADTNQG